MTKTQTALQRRIGRISMLVDILSTNLERDPGQQTNRELLSQLQHELSLLKEVSNRMIDKIPEQKNGDPDPSPQRAAGR